MHTPVYDCVMLDYAVSLSGSVCMHVCRTGVYCIGRYVRRQEHVCASVCVCVCVQDRSILYIVCACVVLQCVLSESSTRVTRYMYVTQILPDCGRYTEARMQRLYQNVPCAGSSR